MLSESFRAQISKVNNINKKRSKFNENVKPQTLKIRSSYLKRRKDRECM